MVQISLICLILLANSFMGLAMVAPAESPEAPSIRKLGKHQSETFKSIGSNNAAAFSPSEAPKSSELETGGSFDRTTHSEHETLLEKHHRRSVDKSVAGGGVILGGLATTFLSLNLGFGPSQTRTLSKLLCLTSTDRHQKSINSRESSKLLVQFTPTLSRDCTATAKRNLEKTKKVKRILNMANEKSVMAVIRASRPAFKNDYDKIAFAVHASFLASGHVLTATGPPAFSDSALSTSSNDEVGIDHWNDLDDNYAFVYINPEKNSKKVLVKCLVMNDKLLVDALADGASEPVHLEINVKDYVGEDGGTNYSAQFKNVENLVKSLDTEVLSKLYGSSSRPTSLGSSEGSSRNINDSGDRSSELTGPSLHPSGVVLPPVNPLGSSDIFPGPGAGMYPARGDFGHGGSMLLGPNDPRWIGGIGEQPGLPGGQPGVPPGARFDPYGPPGIPGFEPNRFVRLPRRPGGEPHPDLPRPGSDYDFI